MTQVVFLRGVNVGGAKVVRSKDLAASLADLDVTSIGAAGTFLVHGKATMAAVQKRFVAALPFACEVIVRPGKEVTALVAGGLPKGPTGAKAFVSVLAQRPKAVPPLPAEKPDGGAWEVQVFRVESRYALSWQRGQEGGRLYPNPVVEKALGVPATTRGWATFASIAAALDER